MENQSGASAGHSAPWHAICPLATLSQHCCEAAKIKQKPAARQLAHCVSRLQQNPSEARAERARVPSSQNRQTPRRRKPAPWLYFTASHTQLTRHSFRLFCPSLFSSGRLSCFFYTGKGLLVCTRRCSHGALF